MTNGYWSQVKKKLQLKKHLKVGCYSPCNPLKKHFYWDVNVWAWALTRLSAVIRKPNTLLYLWFFKGAVCLHESKAYLTDSASKEADLRNKTLISATYADTPLTTATFRGAERIISPILVEIAQHFRRRDNTTPLSSSSVLKQSACLRSKTNPRED